MKLPSLINTKLLEIDKQMKPISFDKIRTELFQAKKVLGNKLDAAASDALFVELVAWGLSINAFAREPWQLYFGPSIGLDDQGNSTYSPDINKLGAIAYNQWCKRAKEFKHSVLKSRYSDLCWELANVVGKVKRDPQYATMAIDAYIDAVSTELLVDFFDKIVALSRALQLARYIKDDPRSESAIVLLMQLHKEAAQGDGFWWRIYDCLKNDRKLNDARRADLVKDLETLAKKYSDESDVQNFDPFKLEEISKELLAYYRRIHSKVDVERVNTMLGKAFEYSTCFRDNLSSASLLQSAANAYADAGLPLEAKRVRIARAKAIENAKEEMHSFPFTHTITIEQMNKFVSSIITENPAYTLAKIANQFVPNVTHLKNTIRDSSEGSIFSIFPLAIMAKNHQADLIGGVDDDIDGRVIHHQQTMVQIESIYLDQALNAAIDKHSLNPYSIAGFAERSGLFDDSSFLIEGILAWFEQDHMKAIHVLVPQVERALRNIAGEAGEPISRSKPTNHNRETAIGMGEIFGSNLVKNILGEDLVLYFKTIYSDPRGLNLRNTLAHGMLEREMINNGISNILIHSMLVFSVWKEIAEHRKSNTSCKN